MRTDTIDSFLDTLAARVPAPGGGASSTSPGPAHSPDPGAPVARANSGER